MADDFFNLLGGVADALGVGEELKETGLGAFFSGLSTQTSSEQIDEHFVYERVLTRPRDPSINDR